MTHDISFIHGHQPTCKSCSHLDPRMHAAGHPRPCSRVLWQDQQRHRPTIDAGVCDEFSATKTPVLQRAIR